MGGDVDFESELGKGSTFWIELPSETSRKDVFARSQGSASDSSTGVKPAPRNIERGKAAGFTDYLVKPLNVDRFLSAVKRSLGQEPA